MDHIHIFSSQNLMSALKLAPLSTRSMNDNSMDMKWHTLATVMDTIIDDVWALLTQTKCNIMTKGYDTLHK